MFSFLMSLSFSIFQSNCMSLMTLFAIMLLSFGFGSSYFFWASTMKEECAHAVPKYCSSLVLCVASHC